MWFWQDFTSPVSALTRHMNCLISILARAVAVAGPVPVSSHYNGNPCLVEGEGSGRNVEIGLENRSLFSCCRIPCSVPAVSRDYGRRRTHPKLVDFNPLANVPADNVSRGGRWFGWRSHSLFDFRSGEYGRIRSHGGRFSFCVSPLSLATELMVWFSLLRLPGLPGAYD